MPLYYGTKVNRWETDEIISMPTLRQNLSYPVGVSSVPAIREQIPLGHTYGQTVFREMSQDLDRGAVDMRKCMMKKKAGYWATALSRCKNRERMMLFLSEEERQKAIKRSRILRGKGNEVDDRKPPVYLRSSACKKLIQLYLKNKAIEDEFRKEEQSEEEEEVEVERSADLSLDELREVDFVEADE